MRIAPALFLLAVLSLSPAPAAAHGEPRSFAVLAEKALPAVVNISTTQMDKAPSWPHVPPGSPMERFLEEFFERRGSPGERQRRVSSLGSGFIVDPSGIIVTNNHVIADAEEILIRLHDESELEAEVVGRDPKTDLAVLKVSPKEPLTALAFGDSGGTRVGDWVVAIGNPFGLGGSVTAGIVSARKRDIRAGPYDEFIQTDAAINKGNSGGPMLNLEGKVIGVNTAIYSPSGGSVGIGFAVPSSLAVPVIDQLRRFRETRRGWLGVRIQRMTDEIAASPRYAGFGEARGALVAGVTENSPADKAGIKLGDVIVGFNGQAIRKMRRLPRIVSETEVDSTVPVEVWRQGKTLQLEVTVGRLEEGEKIMNAEAEGEIGIGELGMTVATPTDALREKYDLDEEALAKGGVVVIELESEGAAAQTELEVGDLIVAVDQDDVSNARTFRRKVRAAKAAGAPSVLLLVNRKGMSQFIAVALK